MAANNEQAFPFCWAGHAADTANIFFFFLLQRNSRPSRQAEKPWRFMYQEAKIHFELHYFSFYNRLLGCFQSCPYFLFMAQAMGQQVGLEPGLW